MVVSRDPAGDAEPAATQAPAQGSASSDDAGVVRAHKSAWVGGSSRPHLTINIGGWMHGVVTVTELGAGEHRVEARWRRQGHPQSWFATVRGLSAARTVANEVAQELSGGWAPRLLNQ
jgi:hypothetical protein